MLDCCDLLQILSKVQYRKLKDVEVYGYITRELPSNPEYLAGSKLVAGATLVEMRIFGVRFGLPDPVLAFHGDGNPKQMYFCNGYLSTCILDKSKIGDWYAIKGNLSIPRGTDDVINLFRFKRGNNGWLINGSYLTDIDLNSWDLKGRMYQYIMQSADTDKFCVPPEVLNIRGSKSEDTSSDEPKEIVRESTIVIEQPHVEEQVPTSVQTEIQNVGDLTQPKLSVTDTHGTRFMLRPKSNIFTSMDASLDKATQARQVYLDKIAEKYELKEETSRYIEYMFKQLKKYWSNKPSSYGHTGKSLVKDYMQKSGVTVSQEYMGTTVEAFLLNLGGQLLDFALDEADLDATKVALSAGKSLFGDAEVLYAGLLARIAGLDTQKLMDIATRCNKLGFSFSELVNTNTYMLLLVSTELRFQEVEELALCLGLANNKSISRSKNIGILFDYTLNSQTGSTIYSKQSLYSGKLGVSVSSKRLREIKSNGTYIIKSRQIDLVAFVNQKLDVDSWSYPKTNWQKDGFNGVLALTKAELDKGIKDFISTGLGVETKAKGELWLSNSKLLEKELFCYNKLYELAQNKIPYDMGEIDSAIAEFEAIKGFQLEDRQRGAVRLTGFGCAVVTGPAGSGKTTVSEAMVYALEKQNHNIKIQYAAPTGKAAKRLQEVVGGTVKTMHSMFGVGSIENDLFDEDDDDERGTSRPDVYFFDENAMVTIDLLYSVLKKVEHPQIFFLGDIEQLPPIGKGLPFKNMLGFLPYVALNVSKRSAEGSNITNNSNIMIKHSKKDDWLPLKDADDCRLMECADESINDLIYDLCAWHLGKSANKPKNASDEHFEADDIQVVSPVATSKYSWSSTRLNSRLQDLFNPREAGKYFVFGIGENKIAEYRLGDRVIHTSNNYTMAHYSSWERGTLQKNGYQGVMNGDVGKVVGVLPSNICKFLEPEREIPECEKSKKEARDDSAWTGDNKYFIVIKYHNYEKDEDFFVLYQVVLNTKVTTPTEQVFSGYDLADIQLAYALTVHKMQGSQGKLVLFALGNMAYSSFLTRNMAYTGLTRAQELAYLVGSVGNNENSALSKARKLIATEGVVTAMDVLLDNSDVA